MTDEQQTTVAQIGSRGRVTVDKDVREDLELEEGEYVKITVEKV